MEGNREWSIGQEHAQFYWSHSDVSVFCVCRFFPPPVHLFIYLAGHSWVRAEGIMAWIICIWPWNRLLPLFPPRSCCNSRGIFVPGKFRHFIFLTRLTQIDANRAFHSQPWIVPDILFNWCRTGKKIGIMPDVNKIIVPSFSIDRSSSDADQRKRKYFFLNYFNSRFYFWTKAASFVY